VNRRTIRAKQSESLWLWGTVGAESERGDAHRGSESGITWEEEGGRGSDRHHRPPERLCKAHSCSFAGDLIGSEVQEEVRLPDHHGPRTTRMSEASDIGRCGFAEGVYGAQTLYW
jgi:hypothetical protein